MWSCDVWFVASGAGSAQQGMRQRKLMLIRTGRGHGDMDPAHTDPDQRADLQQFQPDTAATGPGELSEGQANPAQRAEQHVGKRGEPQAHLVAAEVRSANRSNWHSLIRFSISPRAQ